MDHSALMRDVNRPRKRRDQLRRILFRLRPAGENGIQASALKQLKCDVRKIRDFAISKIRIIFARLTQSEPQSEISPGPLV